MKGLRASIFKSNNGNYPLNCISSKVNEVTIVAKNHMELHRRYQIFESTEDAPPVTVIERELQGKPYIHIEPLRVAGDFNWYMYGGTIIESSDSRFYELLGHPYPVKLHDRVEVK